MGAPRAPNEIGVAVKDGVVTLTGWVDSYTKRWAAEEAAHRVRGVKAVANDIEVRLPSSAERTDADIAAAAVRALEWDAFVPIDKLDVTVSKGWVTLKGEVEWQYQKQDAERVVRRLSGVKGVTNLITVKPRAHRLGAEGKDRAGAGAQRGDRRAADHGRGAREQGHPEGHRALLGREGRGGAGGVVGPGGHLGREPDHDLLLTSTEEEVPWTTRSTLIPGRRCGACSARWSSCSPTSRRPGAGRSPASIHRSTSRATNGITLEALCPGVDRASLDDHASSATSVTIRGERKPIPDVAEERYHRRERPLGAFTRTVSVGERLDPERTQATYTNGILRVQLARAPEATPKKIPIQN